MTYEGASRGFRPRRMRTDVLMMASNKAVVLLAGVGASVVIARALGPSGRGAQAVAIGFAMILVQLGSLGFQTANPYFTAQRRAPIGRVVTNSLWLATVLGFALALVGVGVKLVTPDVVAGLRWRELLIAVGTVPAILAMLFLQGILLGEGRTVAYNVVESSSALGSLGALVAVDAILGLSVTSALAVTMAGYLGGALAFFLLLRGHAPPMAQPDLALVRQMAGYAARIYLTGLLAYAVIRINVLLVNGYLGSREAGFYAVAVALADLVYVIPLVVALNLFPRVARGSSSEASASIFRSVAIPYAAICLAAALLAGTIIPLLYGSDFQEAAKLFQWLAPGAFCAGILNILSYHFAGRGYPTEIVVFWAVGLILNVGINVAFLGGLGTYIAALSSSIAYALVLGLHGRLFAREGVGYSALLPRPLELARLVRATLRSASP